MNYYAQIDIDRRCFAVTQTASPIEGEGLIQLSSYDTQKLGQMHNAATGDWAEPPPLPALRRITPLAFRRRFTKAERTAIEWAAVDRPELNTQQRMQSAALRSDLKDQAQATFIDLDDPDVAAGVQTLEAVGLLEAGRSAHIMGAPVQPEELP